MPSWASFKFRGFEYIESNFAFSIDFRYLSEQRVAIVQSVMYTSMCVFAGYAKRYRYCEYFGKYFCLCCHSNDRMYIPGHILHNWNFGKFPVSHFAHDLLKRIFDDPLFSIEASASSVLLYKKVPVLDEVCNCRTQLFHLSAFISTCTRPRRYVVFDSCLSCRE